MSSRDSQHHWNDWLAEYAGRFLLFARQQTRCRHAAAGIAFAFALSRHPKPEAAKSAPGSEPHRVPIESRRHLMAVTDLGVVSDQNRRPVRLVSATWVDEIIYDCEPVNESRVRQEILPVALRTYGISKPIQT